MNALNPIGDETLGETWDRWERDGTSLAGRRAELALMHLAVEVEFLAEQARLNLRALFAISRRRVLGGWQ